MTRGRVAIGLAVVLLLASGPWAKPPAAAKPADNVEKLILAGLEAHKAGQAARAIDLLQKAITAIQQAIAGGWEYVFPAKAPPGYEAGEIKKQTHALAGPAGSSSVQLGQVFTRTKDRVRVRINLTDSPQLIKVHEASARMYNNPKVRAMMTRDGNRTIRGLARGKWVGWAIVDKRGQGSAQAHLTNKVAMITVNVTAAEAETLDLFVGLLNLTGPKPTKKAP